MAAASFGARGEWCYGNQTGTGLGGNDRGLTAVTKRFSASSGRHGRRQNLAAAMHGRARRRRVDGEATGRPAMLALRGSFKASRRSSWTHRRGEGWPVAMATASGVDELRSGVLGRGSRGRGREQRVRERSEELRGVFVASPGGAGEAGGGAGACSAAVRCPPPLPTGKGRW